MNEDVIRIKVRKDAAEYLTECYGDFGWSLKSEEPARIGKKTAHLTFSRPHYIADKDDLQLLQVRLEAALNNTGIIAAAKFHRAIFAAISLTLLAALFTAAGCLLLTIYEGLLFTALGIICSVCAVCAAISAVVVTKRVYRRDLDDSKALVAQQSEKIEEIRSRARIIRGAGEN